MREKPMPQPCGTSPSPQPSPQRWKEPGFQQPETVVATVGGVTASAEEV